MLVFDRSSWRSLSQTCFDYMKRDHRRFPYPDQDILNLAIGERCTLMSHRWNFPGFLIGSNAEDAVRPHIYHFMSNPRPWIVSVSPWNNGWTRPYKDLLERYPKLRSVAARTSSAQRARYWLQQRLKMITEYGPVGNFSEPPPELVI